MPNSHDLMSTTSFGEASKFRMAGQMYYAPRQSDRTRTPIYRLYGGKYGHIVSQQKKEGIYNKVEATIAYPWRGAYKPAGATKMFRGYNAKLKDHGLMSQFLSFFGYTKEYFTNCYAYARYGGNDSIYTLSGSKVTVKSNLVAGGAVWEYWWNNKQFIDHNDYGREIQSSLSYFDNNVSMPTEAGDSVYNTNRNFMHGAPVAYYANTITPSYKMQSTRAIPLEWCNSKFNGGQNQVVVAYTGWQLGKNLYLDDKAINLGTGFENLNGQVSRYETVLDSSIDQTNSNIEIPSAYLVPEFRRAFTFNAAESDKTKATKELGATDFDTPGYKVYHYQHDVNYGGVILANDDLSYAFGIYGSKTSCGGSADYFTLWKFSDITKPAVTKMSAGNYKTHISKGENKYTTYICVGTYDNVCTEMRQLYLNGYR